MGLDKAAFLKPQADPEPNKGRRQNLAQRRENEARTFRPRRPREPYEITIPASRSKERLFYFACPPGELYTAEFGQQRLKCLDGVFVGNAVEAKIR